MFASVVSGKQVSEKGCTEAAAAQEWYHQFQESRSEMMRGYAEVCDCRREYLRS